jgi:prepilin-type N-terminal cleavage/methylation domain-containing protein
MESINRKISNPALGSRGFTLLEIIVSLALVSIAVVIVMQLFSLNLRAIAASDGYVNASANAEAVMRAVLTDEDFPDGASTSGVIDIYRYESFVAKVNEERNSATNTELYLVKVVVYWRDGVRDKSLTLNTLKLVEKKI